jgi:hypothetical protein
VTRRARRDRTDVQSDTCEALEQRDRAVDILDRGAIHFGGARNVGQGSNGAIAHDDFVRWSDPIIGHGQGQGRRTTGIERSVGQLLLESDPASDGRRQHPLHIQRHGRYRPPGHRCAGSVDEEQHSGEQADAHDHAHDRG